MTAVIKNIFIASESGASMVAMQTARLTAGRGIEGDRYHLGKGKFSAKLAAKGADDWQVTLVESEELEAFLGAEGLNIEQGDFRRNIVTTGVRLNPLVGKRFVVDGITLEGVRLCEPCAYLADLLSERLLPAMLGRCGLRARIIDDGTISVGGEIGGALDV
jgi:MOSC domain-containing protein YiiM